MAEHPNRSTSDRRRIWRVVSVYSDGRCHVEGPPMPKSAAEGLVEDIRLYREANLLPDGGEEPRLVIEPVGKP